MGVDMPLTMDFPGFVFITIFALLFLSTWIGEIMRRNAAKPQDERAGMDLVISAPMSLLFLIIGFSFSMALARYDLRKNCEQAEAIAIGTSYARADLLTPPDALKLRELLKSYLDQRVLFYTTRFADPVAQINAETLRLQPEIRSTVRAGIANVPPPLMGLLLSGIDDVVNTQRISQAAWLNRIPLAAWVLITSLGCWCCWLIAYRALHKDWLAYLIVPIAVAISVFLIADLDSPRGGAIHVAPLNLVSLSHSLGHQ
jgi:hypothetical protein